jgi:hypothetical protein
MRTGIHFARKRSLASNSHPPVSSISDNFLPNNFLLRVKRLTYAPRRLRYPNYLPWMGAEARMSQMTAIARALSRAFATAAEVEVLKQLLLFSLAGLFVSVLLMTYGLDLSPGFF